MLPRCSFCLASHDPSRETMRRSSGSAGTIRHMGKRGRRGECRLCGEVRQLTYEDVYPTWMRKFVRRNLMAADQRVPDKVTLRACNDCNRELGEKFENPVAPILKPLVAGQRVTLDPDELRTVASWLWLKDIEYVLMRDTVWRHGAPGTPITSSDIALWRCRLNDLRRTMAPPLGYVARLGVIGGSRDPSNSTSPDPFVPADFVTEYTGITSFNHFGLAAFQTTLADSDMAGDLVAALAQDERTYVLWPAQATPITVPLVRLPFRDVVRWVDELGFHPDSNIRAGFRLTIPAEGTGGH